MRSILLICCAAVCFAQSPPVQVVVTAEPHHGKELPTINPSDISVTSGKDRLEVLDWQPARGDVQVLLLLDDSSSTEIGTQFQELKGFITSLPPSVQIGIGYMRNGTVMMASDWTTDHAAAAAKLRLPLGSPGGNASPYFSLEDLFKKWQPSAARREVLMISDGVDRYYGLGPDNPYVYDAIEHAQRAGVIVSSIYWRGVGHFGHSYYGINWGQNYLSQMAEATGGEEYWQGFGNPVSFAPYLQDFTDRLNHQYLLTFRPKPRDKAGVEPIRVRTEIEHVDLVAPQSVWVPGR